eukprot:9463315-Ditylum_brightwellii.AAC.1
MMSANANPAYPLMVDQKGRFLKQYSIKHSGQMRNLGPDYSRSVFLQLIKSKLSLKENLLTTHFARRSAATALADAGILMTNLKQA